MKQVIVVNIENEECSLEKLVRLIDGLLFSVLTNSENRKLMPKSNYSVEIKDCEE